MEKDDDFLKKVYDKYLGSDYKLNEGNLNPKNELDIYNITEKKVLDIIKERSKSLKINIDSEAKKKGLIVTSSGAGIKSSPYSNIYSTDEDPNILEVEMMISNFKKMMNQLSPNIPEFLLNSPGCSNLNEGEEDVKTGKRQFPSMINKKNDSFNNTTFANEELNKDKGLENGSEDIFKCWELDLSILEILLEILKIVKVIKTVVIYALSLVNPVIEMVSLIGQCFMNPTAIGLIVQKTTEMLTSLGVSLLGALLEFLWSLLDFECVTDATQEVLDSIKNLMSGVSDAIYEGATGVSFIKENYNSEYWNKLEEKIEESWENQWPDDKDKLNSYLKGKSQDGALSSLGLSRESSASEIATGVLGSLPSSIKDTYNNLINSVKDIMDSISKIAEDTASDNNDNKKNADAIKKITSLLGKVTLK